MAKKTNNEKNPCQTSLDFNQQNFRPSVPLSRDVPEKNRSAKVVYFDSRQEIYRKILDRQMK
jgi:hypothetical protein